MAKRKARFNSLSTPGQKQDCSNYLVELAFLKDNHGIRLPSKFWQLTRYKFRYRREIQSCRRFIKKYGEPDVLFVALNNHITTWTDFARIEVLLQKRAERRERMAAKKDVTPVVCDFSQETADLRIEINRRERKKGMFERLGELEDGKKED